MSASTTRYTAVSHLRLGDSISYSSARLISGSYQGQVKPLSGTVVKIVREEDQYTVHMEMDRVVEFGLSEKVVVLDWELSLPVSQPEVAKKFKGVSIE